MCTVTFGLLITPYTPPQVPTYRTHFYEIIIRMTICIGLLVLGGRLVMISQMISQIG